MRLPSPPSPTHNDGEQQDLEDTDVDSYMEEENPHGNQEKSLLEQRDELARAVSSVRATSVCSDQAIEKMFRAVATRAESVAKLLQQKLITTSYKKSLKTVALQGIPNVFCAVSVLDMRGEQDKVVRLPPLKCVPKKYLRPMDGQKLLRTDSFVNLGDIVVFHREIHLKQGYSEAQVKKQLKTMDISIDGVRESQKGQRKLVVVSVRFLGCIYLWRVYNPLVGDEPSKPSMDEILQ